MVVRSQRRRLLPHRRLPRHEVLLPAGTCRTADLFLPDVDHQLLGHHLLLHVGELAAMRQAHKLRDELDVATASLLEGYRDAAEKRAWFLRKASQPH
jgi:hypothetical protein